MWCGCPTEWGVRVGSQSKDGEGNTSRIFIDGQVINHPMGAVNAKKNSRRGYRKRPTGENGQLLCLSRDGGSRFLPFHFFFSLYRRKNGISKFYGKVRGKKIKIGRFLWSFTRVVFYELSIFFEKLGNMKKRATISWCIGLCSAVKGRNCRVDNAGWERFSSKFFLVIETYFVHCCRVFRRKEPWSVLLPWSRYYEIL